MARLLHGRIAHMGLQLRNASFKPVDELGLLSDDVAQLVQKSLRVGNFGLNSDEALFVVHRHGAVLAEDCFGEEAKCEPPLSRHSASRRRNCDADGSLFTGLSGFFAFQRSVICAVADTLEASTGGAGARRL